ncbi:hypothetical protein GCM10009720_03620 [Yaniella flava]|uniref:Uncharacterized protein n=1 Tax=Yaniella flava TaxID=287930 RepID=A0ABP5FIC5_9MICC
MEVVGWPNLCRMVSEGLVAGVARIVDMATVVFYGDDVEGLMIVRTARVLIDLNPIDRPLQCHVRSFCP